MLSHNSLRAVYSIWLRDVIRYLRDRYRIISSLAQPLLFLFVFGGGLSSSLGLFKRTAALGSNYILFIYPGILAMSVLFTSIFSAISIVWDREFGFLKEIMVAPISRSSIVIGKALGGSTVALVQAAIILLFAPLVGLQLNLASTIAVFLSLLLIAFALTSLGIAVAAQMDTMEGFQMIVNFLIMPMFLLSGAMFPLKKLPLWLHFLTRLDPLTYGVDALRGLMLGWQLAVNPLIFNLALLLGFAVLMISLAVHLFNKSG